jgi:hypothetical protein
MEELRQVTPSHRQPRGFGDWAAWKIVRIARYFMDKATGMDREQQVDKKNPTTAVKAEKPLTEAQWVWFPFTLSPNLLCCGRNRWVYLSPKTSS